MRRTALALLVGGVSGVTALLPAAAPAAPSFVPQVSDPALQPVWYDRWGRWHPPYYGYYYPYGPPRFYAYGPPPPYPYPYRYWRYRRGECWRWGRC